MDIKMADDILKKYELDEAADKEFRIKTSRDTGRMNVGLRLRICADHLKKSERIRKQKRENY